MKEKKKKKEKSCVTCEWILLKAGEIKNNISREVCGNFKRMSRPLRKPPRIYFIYIFFFYKTTRLWIKRKKKNHQANNHVELQCVHTREKIYQRGGKSTKMVHGWRFWTLPSSFNDWRKKMNSWNYWKLGIKLQGWEINNYKIKANQKKRHF